MKPPGDERPTLFDAGAAALRFNAPLGDGRAVELIKALRRRSARSVVDLGCGRGELARLIANEWERATVVGVDVDEKAIDGARRQAAVAGLDDRVRFAVEDAAAWSGPVDAAICIGASHAFGGPAELFARLANVVPGGMALVGDGVWETEPDGWCLDTFGELPQGPDGLASMAEAAGWTVLDAALSTRDEWDAFEGAWIAGVRSVGTPAAHAFADERTRQYYDRYRGVLGFCWLVLSR